MKKVKKIRYFIEYLGFLTLLKIIKIFGEQKSFEWIKFFLQRGKNLFPWTKIARNNLDLVYNLPLEKRETLIDQIYENFAFFIVELSMLNTLSLEQLHARIKMEGLEYVKEFQEQKQPFLIMTGHFANWEIAIAILGLIYNDSATIYRSINNPYVDQFFHRQRQKFTTLLIPKGTNGSKELLKALKKRKTIAMLMDQKMHEGIEVPLLGMPSMTSDGMAKLALKFNYPIVPLQIIRLDGFSQFCAKLHPPLKIPPKTIQEEEQIRIITTNMNQILGDWINQNPSQWFWFHRRWTDRHKKAKS